MIWNSGVNSESGREDFNSFDDKGGSSAPAYVIVEVIVNYMGQARRPAPEQQKQ